MMTKIFAKMIGQQNQANSRDHIYLKAEEHHRNTGVNKLNNIKIGMNMWIN